MSIAKKKTKAKTIDVKNPVDSYERGSASPKGSGNNLFFKTWREFQDSYLAARNARYTSKKRQVLFRDKKFGVMNTPDDADYVSHVLNNSPKQSQKISELENVIAKQRKELNQFYDHLRLVGEYYEAKEGGSYTLTLAKNFAAEWKQANSLIGIDLAKKQDFMVCGFVTEEMHQNCRSVIEPKESPALHLQTIGRGVRLYPYQEEMVQMILNGKMSYKDVPLGFGRSFIQAEVEKRKARKAV